MSKKWAPQPPFYKGLDVLVDERGGEKGTGSAFEDAGTHERELPSLFFGDLTGFAGRDFDRKQRPGLHFFWRCERNRSAGSKEECACLHDSLQEYTCEIYLETTRSSP